MEFYLGTWQTAPSDGFWTDQDLKSSEKVISLAVKSGICGFDTAASYGNGQAQQTLSKILHRLEDRSFLIDTKIMPSSRSVPDLFRPIQTAFRGLGIDCLYLHWPRSGFDNRAFLEQMCFLRDNGTIKKVGVCNMPLKDLEKLVASGVAIDRLQRPLSLLWVREYSETLAFCRENGMELCTYSPLGMGLLSTRYRSPSSLRDARRELFCFKEPCLKAYLDLLDTIEEIAGKRACSSIMVALSWAMLQKQDIVLLGARTEKQLSETLSVIRSNGIGLSEAETAALDQVASRLDRSSRQVCENIFSYNW